VGAGDTSSGWLSRHGCGEPTVQKAWLDGLRNHGWIDGRNLIIEYRYAPSQDRLPAYAAELIALSPDLLIAPNPPAAVALKSATASIPIVFVAVADPVGIGLVQSLSRPRLSEFAAMSHL
jgi:putative ABC transport system substrate-binding protein